MHPKNPNWTVVFNHTPRETTPWIGTGWLFFDDEAQASACYKRINAQPGCCATKRPYFPPTDYKHLAAAHDEAYQEGKKAEQAILTITKPETQEKET